MDITFRYRIKLLQLYKLTEILLMCKAYSYKIQIKSRIFTKFIRLTPDNSTITSFFIQPVISYFRCKIRGSKV